MDITHRVLFSSLMTVFFAIDPSAALFAATGGGFPEIIELPQPVSSGALSVEQALQERQSIRDYKKDPVTLAELSQLLWSAQGVAASGKRTAPSAGALYPLEVFVAVGNVAGISPGVYSYDPKKHALTRTARNDIRAELSKAALGQSPIKNAAAVLVLSAVYERVTVKYGERGVRYVDMEAGHAAQNVYLQAVSLHIGTVAMGAFHDAEVKAVLHLPKGVEPLYIMPIGKKKP